MQQAGSDGAVREPGENWGRKWGTQAGCSSLCPQGPGAGVPCAMSPAHAEIGAGEGG